MTSLWRPETSYGQQNYIPGISGPRPSIWYITRYGEIMFEFFEIFDLARPYSKSMSRSRSQSKLLETCYHMNLTWRLYDNYNRSYGQLCDFDVIYDVIVTSSDVIRPKKLYLWNQWTKTFDLVYYSTRLEKLQFFSIIWPWPHFSRSRSKVKVKVIYDGPWVTLLYGLNY